jgi:hypothetical protein
LNSFLIKENHKKMLTLAVALSLAAVGYAQTGCGWVQDLFHDMENYMAVSTDRCQWSNETGTLLSWKYICAGTSVYYFNYTDKFCQVGANYPGQEVQDVFPECAYNCAATSCPAISSKKGYATYGEDDEWLTSNGGDGEGEGSECAAFAFWNREVKESLYATGACVDYGCLHEYDPMEWPMDVNISMMLSCPLGLPQSTNYTDNMCTDVDTYKSGANLYKCFDDGETHYTFCGATTVVVTPLLALGAFVASLLL